MNWQLLTDAQVVDELRVRVRRERLAQNLSQLEVADRAGVGRATVSRFETDQGYTPSLESFVRILRVLGGLDGLAEVLPEAPIDPLAAEGRVRQRARGSAVADPGGWTWGDDR